MKSNKEFVKEVYSLVKDEYIFLEEYINNKTKILCRHNKCGHEYKVQPKGFIKGNRCPNCNNQSKRKSHEKFSKEVYNLVKDEYIFLEKYITTNTPILCRHNKCGYEWKVRPSDFLTNNLRCVKCQHLIRINENDFSKQVQKLVGNEYTFLEKYIGKNIPLLCKHNKCNHTFKIAPRYFIFDNQRCPICTAQKKTNTKFKDEVYDLVKNEYTFLEEYINNKTKILCRHNKCGYEWKIIPKEFLRGTRCPKCSFSGISRSEKSLLKFIKKYYKDKIIENSRKIIAPYELDIYIPKLKIAIEYCGLYWHSELYLDKNYHLNKLNLCKEKGIRLVQIFEDEWIYKRKIVKSKIRHILGLNKNLPKIYARKCYIKEIDSKKKNKFLDKYHIQGKDMSCIKLGLFTIINSKRKLVAVMTFKIPRNKKINTYELSRFATKRKFNIIGGFSKLLSYFKKNYKWKKIVTHADLRYSSFDDNLYDINGFKLSHQSKPTYTYFLKCKKIRIHKSNFKKSKIKEKLPEIYDVNLTELEMMENSKYLRIYDCGTLAYKYKK